MSTDAATTAKAQSYDACLLAALSAFRAAVAAFKHPTGEDLAAFLNAVIPAGEWTKQRANRGARYLVKAGLLKETRRRGRRTDAPARPGLPDFDKAVSAFLAQAKANTPKKAELLKPSSIALFLPDTHEPIQKHLVADDTIQNHLDAPDQEDDDEREDDEKKLLLYV